MCDVDIMQHVLATTVLAAAVTHHSAFVAICTRALRSFCLCAFGRPDLSAVK
jgi:hypothetical protein